MNKSLRILVWVMISTILVCGFFISKQVFGAETDYHTLSREYNNTFKEFLIHKIETKIKKGMPVTLYLKNGLEVCGIYKGYSDYDDSVWIKEYGHIFQTGYGIYELQDISISVKEPV